MSFRIAMAFVVPLPVAPARYGAWARCLSGSVFGTPVSPETRSVSIFAQNTDRSGRLQSASHGRETCRPVVAKAAASAERGDDTQDGQWSNDRSDESEEEEAAFPADLCDVSGSGCEEDGSPPKNADQRLGPNESFARSVILDKIITLVDYGSERRSTIRDDSVPS
jgi:hypothetical protein